MLNKRLVVIALAMLYGMLLNHCHKDNPLDNVPEVPSEIELLNDDFETYTPGTHYEDTEIIGGKWHISTSGGADNYATIHGGFGFSGSKSLRLEKFDSTTDYTWAASMEPALQGNTSSPVGITFFCYTSNASCQPMIAIGNGPATNATATNMIILVGNDCLNSGQNSIYTNSYATGNRLATMPGGVYIPQVWHNVTISVDTVNQHFRIAIDGLSTVEGHYKNPRPNRPVNFIQLGTGLEDPFDGKVWFDKIRVWVTPSH